MKIIAILISILIFSQSINAVQTCKTYIIDEWPDSRYTVEGISGDNVVTDNKTGLMWKQCIEGLTGADCSAGTLASYTWKSTLDLVSTEDFSGFTDWRVPNLKELRTIVARNCYNSSINETIFPNTPLSWIWSSSPFDNLAGFYAWVVDFEDGNDDTTRRDNNGRVRLVRSTVQ